MVRPDNADRVEEKAQEANTKLTYKWKDRKSTRLNSSH